MITSIVRSLRKSISLQITHDGNLIVKAPFFVPENTIQHFIKKKEDWIFKNIQKINDRKVNKKTYQKGEEYLYLGNIYKLNIGSFKDILITDSLNFPDFLVFRIKKELTNWYIKQAKAVITQQVEYMSKKMNTKYKSIRFS